MKMNEFVTMVADMLETQQRYFKTRSREVLQESKRKEAEVRKAIKEYNGGQQSLFDD